MTACPLRFPVRLWLPVQRYCAMFFFKFVKTIFWRLTIPGQTIVAFPAIRFPPIQCVEKSHPRNAPASAFEDRLGKPRRE